MTPKLPMRTPNPNQWRTLVGEIINRCPGIPQRNHYAVHSSATMCCIRDSIKAIFGFTNYMTKLKKMLLLQ